MGRRTLELRPQSKSETERPCWSNERPIEIRTSLQHMRPVQSGTMEDDESLQLLRCPPDTFATVYLPRWKVRRVASIVILTRHIRKCLLAALVHTSRADLLHNACPHSGGRDAHYRPARIILCKRFYTAVRRFLLP